MLEIINGLEVFFEDCYREVTVREYARIRGISPPTSSKMLLGYKNHGLLRCEEQRRALLYSANRESEDFRDLCRMYWRMRLMGLTQHLVHALVTPTIILYGALSKAEATADSDIDIAVLASNKGMDLAKYEEELGRAVQVLMFDSFPDMPRELAHNVLNGYVLYGKLQWTGKSE